jgi:hypothetical protein
MIRLLARRQAAERFLIKGRSRNHAAGATASETESLLSYGTFQLEAVRNFELVSPKIEDEAVVPLSGKARHAMATFTGPRFLYRSGYLSRSGAPAKDIFDPPEKKAPTTQAMARRAVQIPVRAGEAAKLNLPAAGADTQDDSWDSPAS